MGGIRLSGLPSPGRGGLNAKRRQPRVPGKGIARRWRLGGHGRRGCFSPVALRHRLSTVLLWAARSICGEERPKGVLSDWRAVATGVPGRQKAGPGSRKAESDRGLRRHQTSAGTCTRPSCRLHDPGLLARCNARADGPLAGPVRAPAVVDTKEKRGCRDVRLPRCPAFLERLASIGCSRSRTRHAGPAAAAGKQRGAGPARVRPLPCRRDSSTARDGRCGTRCCPRTGSPSSRRPATTAPGSRSRTRR